MIFFEEEKFLRIVLGKALIMYKKFYFIYLYCFYIVLNIVNLFKKISISLLIKQILNVINFFQFVNIL